ncbi:uncharacterized protein LOC130677583 [Microplitis mediator]|uniref:uncharacterized protein LOC130677583 n=1 Tax=Microplitis mediator TaxID=375433 RepID=UPI002556515E|nr:uncharacterized protein LOC130677583 [Microplitis mediator]
MADIAAKREARRRRILENSESRLQKISGRDESETKVNGSAAEIFEDPEMPEISFLQDNPRHHNQETLEPFERLIRESAQMPTDFTYESPEAPTSPEELANLLLGTASPDVQKKPSILNSFLFNRSIYVVLAILLNLLIILQIDNPIGKSVIVPFFLLLLPRIYIITTQENSPRENMMFAVLMLCNIRPSLIYKIKNSYKIWTLIIHDLNVYIFTFVIFYYAVTRHFVDYEDELAKLETVQVIIDPST